MMIPNSNNSSKSNTPLSKQDDFLNIFEFNNNTTSANDNINGGDGDNATNNKGLVKKENSNDDKYLMSHINSNNNLSFTASSDNFNDLNKLLANTVGNSEYLDMPLPLIFNDNSNKFTSEYQTNNDDFDSHSLLSYTTNNSSMTNNTMTNSISNTGRGRKYSRLGSVKSFRSTAADSIDDEVIKERKKKIHNNVEKKRRELIKNKIQEINELLPLSVIKIVNANYINENIIRTGRPKSELVDPFSIGNKDIKVRKRDILCGSLLYINFLNKIIEKVNKRTDQFENLYEALLKRKNGGNDNNAIKIPKSSVTNENKQTNSTNIEEQSLVYMNNEENKRSSNLPNNNHGDSQYTINSHENIHDLDDFAKFLKSINDVPSQTASTSDIQNSNSINNNNLNNYDTYENLLNMPVFSDDTLKNLLLQNNNNDNNGGNSENNYNNGNSNNNNNQKDSSTNLNDPFSNWINM